MRNKIVLAACVSLFFVQGEFSNTQAQNYFSLRGGFDFTVPDGWIEMGDMEEINVRASAAAGTKIDYATGFKKFYTELPYVYIEIDKKVGKLAKAEIQKMLSSAVRGKPYENATKGFSKPVIKKRLTSGFKEEPLYFPDSQIALWPKIYEVKKKERIQITIVYFSNYGYVKLHFHAEEKTFKKDLNDFLKIMGSFAFKQEFEYGG